MPPSPSIDQWSQIGIGALIALPAWSAAIVLWKDRLRHERETQELNDDALARERELSDRIAPLLNEAVRVLSIVPSRFEESFRTARETADVDKIVEKLTAAIDDMAQPRRHDG